MHRSGWAAAVLAVALVALMAATALPTASPPSGPAAPLAPSSSPAKSGNGNAGYLSFARQVGFPAGEVAGAVSWVKSLTPSQAAAVRASYQTIQTTGQAPSLAVLESVGLHMDDLNYYCFGASTLSGTLIGGGYGFAGGGPIGLVIGAVIGGAVGAVSGYYNCQNAVNGANLQAQYMNWARTLAAGAGNELNITEADYSTLLSSLNVSEVAWERAADHAALAQLPSTTFSIPRDLVDSGVAPQIAPVLWGYEYTTMAIVNSTLTAWDAHTTTGAIYGGVASLGALPAGAWAPTTLPVQTGDIGAAVYGSRTSVPVYLPQGAHIYGGGPITLLRGCPAGETSCPAVYDNLTLPTTGPAGLGNATFEGSGGLWYVTTATSEIYIVGGEQIPTSIGEPITETPAAQNGYEYWYLGNGVSDAVNGYPLTNTNPAAIVFFGGGSAVTPTYSVFPSSVSTAASLSMGISGGKGADLGDNLPIWLGAIELDAATNAEAYWAFLHAIGVFNESQIPAGCLIPAPYLTLPSSVSNLALNSTEWLSMYEAALLGMGKFYNVSLNGTDFCGTLGQRQFHLGGTAWGNLFINATGAIYLNNGTSPVDVDGRALSTEAWANTTTWAVHGDQLLLMPTLSTVTIPVGVKWAVPANDPVEVYAVQAGMMLWATGNGTGALNASGCTAAAGTFCPESSGVRFMGSLSPGDAIYLTSCVVGGSAESNCTVSVQTLNVTVATITCGDSCNGTSSTGGGGFGGLPNPLSWLSKWLSSLFGGGPLGQLAGSIVAALLVLAVVAILVYVAVVEVEAWGGKKRGGGGGSTVFVTGGR